jgi:hypothetical protein
LSATQEQQVMLITGRKIIGYLICWLFLCDLNILFAAQLFPSEQLYPHYLADPNRVTFNAQTMYFESTTVNQTSKRRVDLKLGAQLPLYGSELYDQPWQLVLIGGFHGQFDSEQSQDNIGWDGIYGLHFAHQINESWKYRIGIKHVSSHVGDEYAERTGRLRINYTRQEIRMGVAWSDHAELAIYSDIAYGYDLRNRDLQEPWRLQLGAQYESPYAFWNDQLNWFTAIDISSYEENDWQSNYTAQLGLVTHSGLRSWRAGLEYYDGRNQIGEFFQNQERYISLGIWFDL